MLGDFRGQATTFPMPSPVETGLSPRRNPCEATRLFRWYNVLMQFDPLASRIADEQRAYEARAERLRHVAQEIAGRLHARGAQRVALFGSLVTGASPHAQTDIDLCVEGLSVDAIGDIYLECEYLEDVEVDLVRWETASPALRLRITRDGVHLR